MTQFDPNRTVWICLSGSAWLLTHYPPHGDQIKRPALQVFFSYWPLAGVALSHSIAGPGTCVLEYVLWIILLCWTYIYVHQILRSSQSLCSLKNVWTAAYFSLWKYTFLLCSSHTAWTGIFRTSRQSRCAMKAVLTLELIEHYPRNGDNFGKKTRQFISRYEKHKKVFRNPDRRALVFKGS